MTITAITYAYSWDVGEPIHNYLGYVMLILWIPIFWLYILPLGERKELREKRKQRKKEKREIRKQKRLEKQKKKDLEKSDLM